MDTFSRRGARAVKAAVPELCDESFVEEVVPSVVATTSACAAFRHATAWDAATPSRRCLILRHRLCRTRPLAVHDLRRGSPSPLPLSRRGRGGEKSCANCPLHRRAVQSIAVGWLLLAANITRRTAPETSAALSSRPTRPPTYVPLSSLSPPDDTSPCPATSARRVSISASSSRCSRSLRRRKRTASAAFSLAPLGVSV